jgi:PilZ domain
MRSERRKGARVQFEPPLKVTMMAIDGTWARECLLVDVSESGARIGMKDTGVSTEEFFLVLSSTGTPAFRRCKRAWVEGDLIGVSFDRTQPAKATEQLSRYLENTAA